MKRALSIMFILFFIASLTTSCGLIGGEGEDGEKERLLLDGVKNRVGNVKKRFQDAKKRPCVEHDECFAREHCHEGYCAPYNGTTTAKPRPDMGQ